MARILHLFDASAGWEQRIGWTQLRARLPAGRFTTLAASTSKSIARQWAADGETPGFWPMRLGAGFLNGPILRRRLAARPAEVVHVWSVSLAVLVARAVAEPGLVVELSDPAPSEADVRALRVIQDRDGFAVVCTTQTVRRRLVEGGVDPEVCAVIRPGVDFGAINVARRADLRARLRWGDEGARARTPQAPQGGRVFITPEPAVRGGGQFVTFWATAVRSFLRTGDRLVLPGVSGEQARIARLARRLGLTECLCCPGQAFRFEDLVVISDVLLMPSAREVPTTAIGWAMGAGVPVVATAVYATAELLGHKHNGLLIKPDADKTVAVKLAAMLDRTDELRRVAETARGQAFQVLGVRRYVDQHARLYENLLAGNRPGEGIVDSAVDA